MIVAALLRGLQGRPVYNMLTGGVGENLLLVGHFEVEAGQGVELDCGFLSTGSGAPAPGCVPGSVPSWPTPPLLGVACVPRKHPSDETEMSSASTTGKMA